MQHASSERQFAVTFSKKVFTTILLSKMLHLKVFLQRSKKPKEIKSFSNCIFIDFTSLKKILLTFKKFLLNKFGFLISDCLWFKLLKISKKLCTLTQISYCNQHIIFKNSFLIPTSKRFLHLRLCARVKPPCHQNSENSSKLLHHDKVVQGTKETPEDSILQRNYLPSFLCTDLQTPLVPINWSLSSFQITLTPKTWKKKRTLLSLRLNVIHLQKLKISQKKDILATLKFSWTSMRLLTFH